MKLAGEIFPRERPVQVPRDPRCPTIDRTHWISAESDQQGCYTKTFGGILMPSAAELRPVPLRLFADRPSSRLYDRIVDPHALARKYPNANREWRWQFVFPPGTSLAERDDWRSGP